MFAFLAIMSLAAAGALWHKVTYPYLKQKSEPTSPPDPTTALLGIFWHFYYALVLGAEKKDTPKGVYLHGAFLVLAIVFVVLSYSTGELAQ